MLLDEGCLAREGTRRRCSPLSGGLRRSKPWLLHGRVHVRRWSQTVSARPHHAGAVTATLRAMRTAPKGWVLSQKNGHAPAPCKIFKGQSMKESGCMGLPGPRDQSVSGRVERPDDRHSRKQAVQRSGTRRHGQCRHRSRVVLPRTPDRKSRSIRYSTTTTISARTRIN